MIVDGEALIELVTTSDGLRLRALPAELIDSQKTVNLSGAREIIAGVEYDSRGAVSAFWLHPRPGSGGLLEGFQPSVRGPGRSDHTTVAPAPPRCRPWRFVAIASRDRCGRNGWPARRFDRRCSGVCERCRIRNFA